MPRAQFLLLIDVALAAFVSVDLIRALRIGRARGRGGTITRRGRPEVLIWILIAPQTF